MNTTPGRTLAHYKVLEKLGSGGMGDAYLAEDTELERKIALKVLPHDLAESEERRARFKREAKSIAALNHPNIVTVFSVGGSSLSRGSSTSRPLSPMPSPRRTPWASSTAI